MLVAVAKLEGSALGVCLDGIERQAGVLHIPASSGSEVEIGVQGGVPASKEAALDLRILRKAGLANTLRGERILLQSSGKRILSGARVVLVQQLAASQTGTSNGVAEGLGLRLGGRGGNKSGLGLGRGCRGREKGDLFANGASKVLEGLLDVGGIVVGLSGVL